jgi:hypothetical protein
MSSSLRSTLFIYKKSFNVGSSYENVNARNATVKTTRYSNEHSKEKSA